MDELRCPCTTLIPLYYNPDREGEPPRPVEPEKLSAILSVFDRQFGGVHEIRSVTPTAEMATGSWQGQREQLLRVQVAVLPRQTGEFRTVVSAIGKELGQVAMYCEIGPPCAVIIFMDQDGMGDAGPKTLFDGIA